MDKQSNLLIDRYLVSIRTWMEQNEVSPHILATRCGFAKGSLRHIHTDGWNPQVSTLRTIEEYIVDHTAKQRELLMAEYPLDLGDGLAGRSPAKDH